MVEYTSQEILNKLEANDLQPIDSQDTIKNLIDKLNFNFACITDTGIFNIEENIPEDNHDYLCDALLIKPHQPIHRRKRILEPLENRKDISWLNNVDYLLGDVAIVEQKRIDNSQGNRVYMYTIRQDNAGETILDYETELTGPTGKNGEIYLTYDSQTILENTFFNELNADRLNVSSLNITDNGSLTTSEVVTNKLIIGNLIFNNTGEKSELATNNLNVDTIFGFRGKIDTITFGSPIIIDKISSSDINQPVEFETPIGVDKLVSYSDNKSILMGSAIKGEDTLDIDSPICVDEIKSYKQKNIKISSPFISNNEIGIIFESPIITNHLKSKGEYLSIESPITSSIGKIEFNTSIDLKKTVHINEQNLDFTYYKYTEKHVTPGVVIQGFDNIFSYSVPELNLNKNVNFSRLEGTIPYSFVPMNGNFYIAEVKKDENIWYMLITKRIKPSNNKVRVVTNQIEIEGKNIDDDNVYDLIASNDIYKDIFGYLKGTVIHINNKPITIGITEPNEYSTYTGCTINIRQIPSYSQDFGFGNDGYILKYFLTLY